MGTSWHNEFGTESDECSRIGGTDLEVVEEDAADAATLVPVRHQEVVVAPALEARVVAGVVGVAGRLQRAVEVHHVLLDQVVGRQVGAAAEPPLRGSTVKFFFFFK